MMTPKPIRVEVTRYFRRAFKQLQKKLRHLDEDLKDLITALEQGETPGVQIAGVGLEVYKVRLASRDIQRGKSGGLRVLYYVKTPEFILLIEIYFKSEQEDISSDEVQGLIEEAEQEVEEENEEE